MQFPTYFELCRLTWRQYLARFDIILALTLLIALPTHLLISWALPDIPALESATTAEEFFKVIVTEPKILEMLAWNALSSAVLVFLSAALIVVLRASYQRRSLRLGVILQVTAHYYFRVLLTSIIVGILTFIGLIMFIVPGIIAGVYLSFAVPVIIWENKTPLVALKRSIALVHGQARYVFLYILMTQLFLSLLVWVIMSLLPTTFIFEVFTLTVSTLINNFAIFFETVLFSACLTWWNAAKLIPEIKPKA